MTTSEWTTEDGRHAEKLRRAAELQAQWDAEDAVIIIDLRTREVVAS